MSAIQTVCIVVMLAVVLLFGKCHGYPSIRHRIEHRPICEPCTDCGKCPYGYETSDLCSVKICRKGPGERCGGIWGSCGEGMLCSCHRCIGCSTNTLNCTVLAESCRPPKGHYQRY